MREMATGIGSTPFVDNNTLRNWLLASGQLYARSCYYLLEAWRSRPDSGESGSEGHTKLELLPFPGGQAVVDARNRR